MSYNETTGNFILNVKSDIDRVETICHLCEEPIIDELPLLDLTLLRFFHKSCVSKEDKLSLELFHKTARKLVIQGKKVSNGLVSIMRPVVIQVKKINVGGVTDDEDKVVKE